MDNVLTVKGERKPDRDTTDKDYFVTRGRVRRVPAELPRSPEGVDATQVEGEIREAACSR